MQCFAVYLYGYWVLVSAGPSNIGYWVLGSFLGIVLILVVFLPLSVCLSVREINQLDYDWILVKVFG